MADRSPRVRCARLLCHVHRDPPRPHHCILGDSRGPADHVHTKAEDPADQRYLLFLAMISCIREDISIVVSLRLVDLPRLYEYLLSRLRIHDVGPRPVHVRAFVYFRGFCTLVDHSSVRVHRMFHFQRVFPGLLHIFGCCFAAPGRKLVRLAFRHRLILGGVDHSSVLCLNVFLSGEYNDCPGRECPGNAEQGTGGSPQPVFCQMTRWNIPPSHPNFPTRRCHPARR